MELVSVQIVIAGLCTLMNVTNKDTTYLPPPALIIPKADTKPDHGGIAHPHVGFIAWDSSKIDVAGINPKKVIPPTGSTNFVYVELEGDEITIKDLPADSMKKLDLSLYKGIARHSEYWRFIPSKLTYDSHYVPLGKNRMGTPDDAYVAGYFRFGTEGALKTDRLTTQEWRFRDETTSNYTVQRAFPQEVQYTFPGTVDANDYAVAEIKLADLANLSSDRKFTLKAKFPNTDLQFFMGSGTAHGIYYLVERVDPDPDDQCRSTHFRAIHMMAHTTNTKEWPIPEPVTPGANCSPAGDSTGYCGPDGKP